MRYTVFNTKDFAEWLRRVRVTRPITRIQNHHTWSPDYSRFTGANHRALVEAMRDYHVNENGWADIGQHITTFPDGMIALCRPFAKVPACIKGANSGAICIEHLGNFDRGKDQMTDAHRECAIEVNALLCQRFGLPVDTDRIVYHHWYELDRGLRNNGSGNNKSCPGNKFFGGNKVADCERHFLPLVRSELDRLSGGRPAPAHPESPIYAQRVGLLEECRVKPCDDGYLCIRSGPNARSRETGRLMVGAKVQIFGRKGSWARIDLVEQRWVSIRFLTSEAQPGPHEPLPSVFDLPAPDGADVDSGSMLWGTYYYGQPATETQRGIVLRNRRGDAVGPCVSQKNWCMGAMEGTLIVTHLDGVVRTYNFECNGTSQVTSCRAFFPSLSARELGATEKVCWKRARGPFGDGAARYILVPYRTLAVDRTKIPLGTAVYIPSARGVTVLLPDGTSLAHDGFFFAGDVGGKIRGTHVDFFLGPCTRNPFPFVKSTAAGKFAAHRVRNPRITAALRAMHTQA